MIARNPTSPIPGVHSLAQNLDFFSEGFILSQAIAQSAAFWLGAFILLRCLLTSIIHSIQQVYWKTDTPRTLTLFSPWAKQACMGDRSQTDR